MLSEVGSDPAEPPCGCLRHLPGEQVCIGSEFLNAKASAASRLFRITQVLEEAPAPGITAEFRRGICDTAIAAAHAVGYVNAGTVEFIVDADSCPTEPTYFFCEMNTRLQARTVLQEPEISII